MEEILKKVPNWLFALAALGVVVLVLIMLFGGYRICTIDSWGFYVPGGDGPRNECSVGKNNLVVKMTPHFRNANPEGDVPDSGDAIFCALISVHDLAPEGYGFCSVYQNAAGVWKIATGGSDQQNCRVACIYNE